METLIFGSKNVHGVYTRFINWSTQAISFSGKDTSEYWVLHSGIHKVNCACKKFSISYVPACLQQNNTPQPFLMSLLVLDFVISILFCTSSICLLPSNGSFNTSNNYFGYCAWQTKMCLQENLVDCVDCGGLVVTFVFTRVFQDIFDIGT